ncbi:MAG: hypothetical protein R6U15_06480, partial [Candidatus Izemoplasmatales bacterium]
ISESGWNPPLVKAGDIGIFFRNGLNNQNENGSGLVIAPQDNPNEPGWEYKKGIRIAPDGNVGIGTPDPNYKLSVNGKIECTDEIIVCNNNLGCDFVFDDDYSLPSFKQRMEYVIENNHLMYLPSSEEIQKNGAKMASISMGMLRNLEEHEIYLYEHENDINELKEKIKKKDEMINELIERINLLEKKLNK